MARIVRGGQLNVVPDRVLSAPFDLSDFPRAGTRTEGRKANPYKIGDVVWSKAGRRALVLNVTVDRVVPNQESATLLPLIQVREETATGGWSKQWVWLWPGDIDRGFEAFNKRRSE